MLRPLNKLMNVRVTSIVNPRTILFAVASLNLLWLFTQSRYIHEFGSTKISFCVVCPWYWDLTLTSPPLLFWIACLFLLLPFRPVIGTAVAVLISGYESLNGYSWLSVGNGFPEASLERIGVLKDVGSLAWWELLDLQYLFGFVIFIAATICLIAEITCLRLGGSRRTLDIN